MGVPPSWTPPLLISVMWMYIAAAAAAAAAAKSLQSCPTLCDPIDGSPPGSTAKLNVSIWQGR